MKAFRFICIALIVCLFSPGFGQSWNIVWNKELGNQRMDYFKDVIEDINGGYTVLGSIFLQGGTSYDFWLVRFNDSGDTLWTKTLGTDFTDVPKRLVQVDDGSYILTGMAQSENQEELLIVKTDTDGNELWRKSFGGDSYFAGEDLVALDNDGFLMVGSKGADKNNVKSWIIKLDNNGETVWERFIEEDINGCCKSIKKLPDGGFAITGQMAKNSKNDCDMWVARLNSNFESMWMSNVPSPNMKVWPECICCSPDSCFMLVGWQGTCFGDINVDDPTFDYDMLLVKMDKKGKVLWTKNFDKEGSEGGNTVTIRPDGNFIVGGIKATSFLGKIGPWLTLVDTDGNLVSEKLIEMHFNGDQAIKIINCSDGSIVVIGPGIQDEKYSRSNGWIMKLSGI